MCHYVQSIQSLGSTDGFNSESPKCLHIDYAKDAYQASSKVDYITQMTHWLELQEAVFWHSVYLDWVMSQSQDVLDLDALDNDDDDADKQDLADSDTTDLSFSQFIQSHPRTSHGYHVAKSCPFLNISVSLPLTSCPPLQTFLTHHFPHSSIAAILLLLPWQHHISDLKWLNRLQAYPAIPNCDHRKPPSPTCFDVAFVIKDCQLWQSGTGFNGLRIAQIHAIFKLPSHYGIFPHPLAYVKWFRLLHVPEPMTNLYRLTCSTCNQWHFTSVISIQDLLQAAHLMPRFGQSKVDVSWINGDVLETSLQKWFLPSIMQGIILTASWEFMMGITFLFA
ncbi:hypothetical protein EDB19DRAFT_1829294 [Suillus lakei]|nr:hypothetical protein EDB19DRAFT_1829294 [Suillus lakei]